MDINHIPIPTYSKEMENEYAMSSVRRCAFIKIDSLEFIRSFESTPEILITMSMENRRNKKLMSPRFSANNGNPFTTEINAEYQLIYSHNVKYHRDPILRIAVENTRAKTFSRHRSIAATLVSMQQIVQHDFDGTLMLYECHVSEKNVLARIQLHIRSQYIDDQEGWEENSEDPEDNQEVLSGIRFSFAELRQRPFWQSGAFQPLDSKHFPNRRQRQRVSQPLPHPRLRQCSGWERRARCFDYCRDPERRSYVRFAASRPRLGSGGDASRVFALSSAQSTRVICERWREQRGFARI